MLLRNHLVYFALTVALSSCTLPAYIVQEYGKLPEGLNKKEYKRVVEERNSRISSELGYVKMYDLVKVSPAEKRNKLFLERELFEHSYVLPKDSSVIAENLKRLISINNRLKVWPSVYEKVYGDKLNPHYWTFWMSHEKQQLVRDSIDRATLPILAVSQYRFDPTYYIVYKQSMKIKKYQQARK
jgi:hypothetical protein